MAQQQSPGLAAKMAVGKIFTRYQQAVQSVAEDLGPEEMEEATLAGALFSYSDAALEGIARETANMVLRAGRADGLGEATQGQKVIWRRSSVLDKNTCDACEAADGEEIDGPDDDLSAICEGNDLCRCIPYADLTEGESEEAE